MRVLLIDPPAAWRTADGGVSEPPHTLPLGLALLAAVARRDGHDAAIHLAGTDPWNGRDTGRAVDAALAETTPDVIGITAGTTTLGSALAVARRVRATRPDARVVVGGPHATLLPETVLSEPAVDVVVRGEADETWPALLRALSAPVRDDALASVEGLSWRAPASPGPPVRDRAGALRETPAARPVRDLDTLPPPAHDVVLWGERALPAAFAGVLTARGCAFDCLYCAAPTLSGGRVRRRSPESVATEVAGLVRDRGVGFLFFQDSVFTAAPAHADAVLAAIERAVGRLPFTCQTRADRIDADIARRLADRGCHRVMLGIESGVPETLARIHKPTDLDEPRRAARALQNAGVATTGFFMVGFPWEDEAAMEQTVDYAVDLGLDAVHLFSAIPLPGTGLAELTGVRLPTEGERTPLLNLTTLSDDAYRACHERLAERVMDYNLSRVSLPPVRLP